MQSLLLGSLLFAIELPPVQAASPASTPIHSSDGQFEIYSTPQGSVPDVNGKPYYAGEKLFLRAMGDKVRGAVVRENDRYLEAQWCPCADLLGVEDHWDTHQSDVYVYEVYRAADHAMRYRLVFRSPWNEVDHLWTIEGWDAKRQIIRLKIDQWGNDDILGHEHWPKGVVTRHYRFHLGTTALADEGKE